MSAESLAFDIPSLVITVITTTAGALAWVARKTFTNEKQVAVIQESLKRSDEERQRYNKTMENNIHELRDDIKSLLSKIPDR